MDNDGSTYQVERLSLRLTSLTSEPSEPVRMVYGSWLSSIQVDVAEKLTISMCWFTSFVRVLDLEILYEKSNAKLCGIHKIDPNYEQES